MADNRFSFSQDNLKTIAEDILKFARKRGATACEVDVSEGFGQSVTVRRDEVDTIEYNRDKGVGVTIYDGQKRGYASTSDFSKEALKATVDAAVSIARFTAPDAASGLPHEALLAKDFPDFDLYHPWKISTEDAIELASRCERAAFAVSPEIRNSDGASVSMQESHFISANSLGFMGGYASSRHYLSCSVIAGEGDDMQRDDWYTSKRDPAELADADEIGTFAARRALARLGARQIPTCEVPVLFEAPVANGLLGAYVQATSGGSLYRKASFLLDSLGQRILPEHVDIDEDPHIPRGKGSAPFDDEGVRTLARKVVERGVVQSYFLSSYSARKLGLRTTGHAGGSQNLALKSRHTQPGDDLDAMLRKLGRGLFVTELMGQGVNYVTGDYSRGAAGFWVEGGRIAFPVHEITIAGNLKQMFQDLAAVGADVYTQGSKSSGSVLISRMKLAGS